MVSESVPGGKNSVVRHAVLPVGRNERCQLLCEFNLAEDEVCGSVCVGLSQGENEQPVRPSLKPGPGKGWPQYVAAEPFQTFSVTVSNDHGGMQVVSLVFGTEAREPEGSRACSLQSADVRASAHAQGDAAGHGGREEDTVGVVIAVVLAWFVGVVALGAQPALGGARDVGDQLLDFVGGWRGHLHPAHRVTVGDEHAVEEEHVKMHVQIQCRAGLMASVEKPRDHNGPPRIQNQGGQSAMRPAEPVSGTLEAEAKP